MKITWHGHSVFEIRDRLTTLIDPFLTGNRMADVTADEMDPDVIAVTHGHADHLGDTVSIAKATGCKVVAVSEIAKYLQSKGVSAIGANIGGTVELEGVKYSLTPASHSNGIDEAGFGWDAGSPAGFVIKNSCSVYHAGDTALFNDMTLIRDIHKPKVAMLPIGGRFTMDIEQAALAVKMIAPRLVIPMHYDTFDVIQANVRDFERLVKDVSDAEVILMEPGDSIDV
jgi:L-ascorbate metabolism protein UlaG (beta-lactamase superfamily)